jgi:hypothetical protein
MSERIRKWLSRRIWALSVRVYDDFHETTVVDAEGDRVATFGAYGQTVVTWQKPYDLRTDHLT